MPVPNAGVRATRQLRFYTSRQFSIKATPKVKEEIKVKIGIEAEAAKKIVRLLKDSKLKVQASIQGEAVRVTGAKRDLLQETITLVKKSITDFPLQFQNFRD